MTNFVPQNHCRGDIGIFPQHQDEPLWIKSELEASKLRVLFLAPMQDYLAQQSSFPKSPHTPVQVNFSYLADVERYNTERPYAIEFEVELESEEHRTNIEFEPKTMPLTSIRGIEHKISIEEHGFEVLRIPPFVGEAYFAKNEQLGDMDGVAKLMKERFNTNHVFCHTHRYRKAARADGYHIFKIEQPSEYSLPVNNPHADYTRESGLKRVERHLTEEELARFSGGSWRIRIVNFWKPLKHTIENSPLAFCARETVFENQVVPCDLISPTYAGGFSLLKYNPQHRWYYLEGQQVNEAFFFLSFDSDPQPGQIPYCFHASCHLPSARPDAAARESMEVRALVITKKGVVI